MSGLLSLDRTLKFSKGENLCEPLGTAGYFTLFLQCVCAPDKQLAREVTKERAQGRASLNRTLSLQWRPRTKPVLEANKIDHECVSVDALVEYLKRCGHQDVQVQREQHDPPDFWLHVDGIKFAVEETSIVEQESVTKKGFAGAKWEGEVQAGLARLIQNAVSSKRSKLEKNGVPQQCGDSILCLYDAYGYGDTEDAQVALRNVRGYYWFHSIFWAAASFVDLSAGTPQVRRNELYPQEPGRIGSFLYTRKDRWKR